MRAFFFGKDGRIRSGWRAFVFLVTFSIASYYLIAASLVIVAAIPFGGSPTGYLPLVLPFGLSTIAAVLLGWGWGRFFEGLPFRALGLALRANWLKNLGLGFAVGAVAIGSAILISAMGGGFKLELNNTVPTEEIAKSLLTTFYVFFIGALSEETLFRGYLLQTFVRSESSWIGIALTSILFTLAHTGNTNINSLALANTLLAGLWFAAAYMKTRDLWFPIGIHFIWNWLQGPFFGVNVSGFSELSAQSVVRATDNGPAWLTGGNYGIEGGIACTIAILISLGWIYYLPGAKPDAPTQPES